MNLPDARTIREGARKIVLHPQLWLTVFVAIAIFASFIYVATRFADIAKDAQERLVNVRVGALQDAFAPLATLFFDEPDRLEPYVSDIASGNPTIVEFLVAEETEAGWIVVASLDSSERGAPLAGYDLALSLASADPAHSFTIEETDGSERFFRTARAVTSADGSVIGAVVTRQTLSEADQQIARNITVSFLILFCILALLLFLFFHHARIIDYTELYRRLKEVDTLKDDFVSMVSHELRSPLTIIRGYASELREGGLSADNAPELLARIESAANAQNLLIADILDVARIEQGRLEYHLARIDPKPVVEAVAHDLSASATAKGLSLSAAIPAGVRVNADPDRLRQIITNLITNAIKYSDRGEIRVVGTADAQRLIIRVSDTGIGMSAEDVRHLFEKFHRVSGERVRKETGTGLGLWITKQLVEAMRGTISVESIKGVGSHFILSFPLSKA